MTNLAVAIGIVATLSIPALDRLLPTGQGLDVRNHSTLELLMVAIAILLAYATFERWRFRERSEDESPSYAEQETTSQTDVQDDGRHAA